jgi:hypothetical protein
MKRRHVVATAVLIVSFSAVAMLLIGLGARAPIVVATTNSTISADGSMADWSADELMETDNGGSLYVTWDESNLYVGLGSINVDIDGVFFVYIDVIPGQGTSTGQDWNGTHTLPFDADYGIAVDSGFNVGWLVESSGSWSWNAFPGSHYVGWTDVPTSEFQIPWTSMGSPTGTLYVMALFQDQADNDVTASWPTPNPASSSGSETFTHFYHFPSLVGGISPSASVLADHIVINELDNYSEWIELYNPTASAVDISGWRLTADIDSLDYTVPGSTVIAAGGYWTYTTSSDLDSGGDVVNLYNDSAVLVDRVAYGNYGGAPAPSTVVRTVARVPNGTDTDDDARDWNLTASPTLDAANDVPAVLLGSSLVLNEFDNYPISGNDMVEIHNPTMGAVTLTNWLISDGDAVAPIVTSIFILHKTSRIRN